MNKGKWEFASLVVVLIIIIALMNLNPNESTNDTEYIYVESLPKLEMIQLSDIGIETEELLVLEAENLKYVHAITTSNDYLVVSLLELV